jgi:hypothetical protein
MSKARKSIKPARKVFHASGTAMSAIICPATSSMTTICGSFEPSDRETWVAAGIPIAMTATAITAATIDRFSGGKKWANPAHSSTVAAEPQVPGPGLQYPSPQKVPTKFAHNGIGEVERVASWGATDGPSDESCDAGIVTIRPRCPQCCAREVLPPRRLPVP